MNLLKRVLAGVSAIAMMANPSVIDSYTVFAEGEPATTVTEPNVTEPSTTETETTTTTEENTTSVSSSSTSEITETTTVETEVATTITEEEPIEPSSEESGEKLPAPSFNVNIPFEWTNSTENWITTGENNVSFYYELSDTDFPEATEMPETVEEWNNGENLPQGSHNIRFWAVYTDGNHFKGISNPKHYYLDRTAPTEFSLNTNEETDENNNNILVVTNSIPIVEDGSGIKEIYYTINGERISDIDYTNNEEEINFDFEITKSFEKAEVYVVDNAGNSQSASVNIEHFDAKAPEISGIQVVNISYEETDIEHKNPVETGQEPHNYTNYIYANDSSYLKVEIGDDYYNDLKIKVNAGGKEHEYLAENLINAADKLSSDGKYYVQFSQLEINPSESCEISVTAEDSKRSSESKPLSSPVFYDPVDEEEKNDSKVAISYDGEYITSDNPDFPDSDDGYDVYFSGINTANSINVTLTDDVGIAEYSIKSNGEVIKTENFINTENNQNEATYTIPLEDDGEYKIEVTVTDLAGNTTKETRNICVDTFAPQIIDSKCKVVKKDTDAFLHYVTFGIYSKSNISLQFKINDDLSGVQKVLLYWDKEKDPYEAKYDANTGVYIFEELPTGNAQPRIEVYDKLGNNAVYYFEGSEEGKSVNVAALTEDKNNVHLILESEAPTFELTPTGNYVNETGEIYFGVPETGSHNNLSVNITDNEGIYNYQIKIFHEGKEIYTGKPHDLLTGAEKAVLSAETESINLDEFESGYYQLCVEATDIAGNKIENSNKYVSFYVDKDAPEIDGNGVNYEVTSSILQYFTFGIFGNNIISINLDVNDSSSGIKDVYLYWYSEKNGELTKYALEKTKKGKYQVSGLSPYGKAVPYIEITDKLENTSRYYFTTNAEKKGNKTIGELILDNGSLNDDEKAILVLEDEKPVVSVTVPEDYKKYQVGDETWYSEEVEYYVTAQDSSSGLNRIIVNENNSQIDNITSTDTGERFDEIQQLDPIEKKYSVSEGEYNINVKAFDNASNESEDDANSKLSFNVDTTNPEITGFKFGKHDGAGFKEETETYGFYFKEKTEARVYVDDKGVDDKRTSSGIAGVTLYFTESNGKSHSSYTNKLEKDENGTYAFFEIPVRFKGRVSAEVTDNVSHSSGVINADGSIVEDELIHNNTSSIIISAPDTSKHDAENKPLYNGSIPLEITVNDSFSGISQIEWSVAGDNESGTIHIDNNGKADSEDLTIVSTENNLVTSLKFNLSVDSNTNGNIVNIKFTDRSGNTSEITEVYSIDTTTPVIQTSFENNDVKNESHYKAEQKVNITINERNFDGSEVQILLNGVEQQVIWDDDGSTIGQDYTEHHASFTISDDGDYNYEINYTDRAGNPAETFKSSEITIDTQKPTAEISFDGNYKTTLGESGEELYFGVPEGSKPNVFIVTAKDTNGLDYYQISIADENGNPIEEYNRTYRFSGETDRVTEHKSDEINLENLKSGKYTISAYVVDLAGNVVDEETNHMTFYVDIDAPEVENSEYKSVDSLLRYFTFGIFGNTKLTLSVDVKDNVKGCGIENVSLFWAGKGSGELVSYSPSSISDGNYTFTELPVDCEAVPYIEVTDYMGNRNTYYFTTVESGSEEKNIGKLALNNQTNVTLALENIKPEVNISIPETYKKYTVNGEVWYPGDISYRITAVDKQSGLNRINVQENDKQTELTSKDDVQFISNRYCNEAEYTYQITEANDYNVNVYAVDNAGNKTDDKALAFHIDKENPQIRMFQFGEGIDNGSDFEKTTYGFYFMNKTEARVYVDDPGVTSGFKGVTLFLSNINNTNQNTTVSGTDLYTDENGTYASFMIPMGFKGKVTAEVVDNVEHSSGNVNADGNIIEDESIHDGASSIDIHEDIETDRTDSDNIPLYNSSIPLTITVSDSFSGISTIEWSISNDEESNIISIDNNGNPSTDDLTILSSESNLVTSVQFNLSVDSNTNGNTVHVKLTDRSGNVSEMSRTYSIDTTAPVINAEFANKDAHNESYYTDSQTVNISITERNFDSNDVQVLLNGTEQSVSWEDSSLKVDEDSSVHHGSFEVAADGDYTYKINYTDRAGNSAAEVESSQFTIDNTTPIADISFDSGDKNLEDDYYNKPRTATFTVNEHNYQNAIITVMKDDVNISDKFNLDNWEHSDDIHTQNVTLSENGYYKVSVKVTDMAENTIEESSKGFFIDNDSPVVSVSVENVADGEPSNAEIIEPFVSVEDKEGNLDPETITLKVTAIKLNENHEIVPDIQTYIGLEEWKKASVGTVKLDNEQNPNKIEFSFNNLKDDGIYTFEVTASDKAGNTGGVNEEDQKKGSKYKISVNRLGSTYEIDSKVTDVSPDLRYFRNQKDNPFSFKIVEYNVSQLEKNETIVKMTCDGTLVENNISAEEETGSDRWSIYTYEFPAELMKTSGKYIVKLYSVDEAGNENPVDDEVEHATVTFFIDNDDPILYFRDADDKTEFMNDESYNTDSKHIEVEVYDNSQQEAKNVVFKLNDEILEAQHEDGTMLYTLSVSSKSSAQNLNVSLEDIAGNHVDSGVDNFLITTNFIVLWFNNTPLFICSITVSALIIAVILFILLRKKRRRTRF